MKPIPTAGPVWCRPRDQTLFRVATQQSATGEPQYEYRKPHDTAWYPGFTKSYTVQQALYNDTPGLGFLEVAKRLGWIP